MRSLIRRPSRAASDDRGAVAVLVGVLLGAGVLLGFAALTIDVGKLYVERAELQNGADAGALAVAKSCLFGECDTATAETYADDNAKDDLAAVDLVCGEGEGLASCPPSGGRYVDCPVETPEGNYAEVRTSTETADGSLLPPSFAQTIAGNEGYEGTTVGACARAGWGSCAENCGGLALTISACEWEHATNDGTNFAPAPPETVDPSYEVVLVLHSTTGGKNSEPPPCPSEPSGADLPGGFGWTDPNAGSCETEFDPDGTYSADPGNGVSQDCKDVLQAAYADYPYAVTIPIYTEATGQGTGGTYTLWQPAKFVITGYALPGLQATSPLTGRKNCKSDDSTNSDKCIYGYFTTGFVSGSPGTGPDAGGRTIKLSG